MVKYPKTTESNKLSNNFGIDEAENTPANVVNVKMARKQIIGFSRLCMR